jgi:hypothetical protein
MFKKDPMSFEGGTAIFLSRYSAQLTWCNGVPKKIVVDGDVVSVSKKPIQFENNVFRTKDPEEVEALVTDTTNYKRTWGWRLDPSCIPAALRDYWPKFSNATQLSIIEQLCEGADPEHIFMGLSDDDLAATKEEKVPLTAPRLHVCPVPGCGLRVEGEMSAEEAHGRMFEHVRLVHPSWDGVSSVAQE